MAHVMLPSSKKAIPKTNVERNNEHINTQEGDQTAEIEIAQVNPEGCGQATTQWEPVPQTKSEEERLVEKILSQNEQTNLLGKEAQVWKTYVADSDRSDKEMVEGRNSSLDVLLTKAALFSAISTAFIIESLSDLKPDPAESSAQTLLLMSQTLMAMANNQPVSLPAHDQTPYPTFSPSRSAVVVNILWLLSLSLSVAVSLIAMLAKDWCYKFMSNRVGPMYEQARKRQQKWNGIEIWKMEEVLAFLPWMLHMALLLFAIGLCIYLWNINTSVGLPVTIVTALVTCLYACTTALPIVDGSCPYSTPITGAFKSMASLANTPLARPLLWIMHHMTGFYSILQRRWWKLVLGLDPDSASYTIEVPGDNTPLLIDNVTSQMLAWMIKNCEDSRSVEVALQAIGNARHELPPKPLLDCNALALVSARLEACAQLNMGSKTVLIKQQDMLLSAQRYGRAYAILQFGSASLALYNIRAFRELSLCQVHDHLDKSKEVYTELSLFWHAKRLEIDDQANAFSMLREWKWDLQRWAVMSDATAGTAPNSKDTGTILDANAIGRMPMTSEDNYDVKMRNEDARLSVSRLFILLRLSAQYLVLCWANEVPQKQIQCRLPTILIRIFFGCRYSEPTVANMIAVIMAAATLAVDSRPDLSIFTRMANTPQRRALRMLQFYQAGDFRGATRDNLFLFALSGLLPRIDISFDCQGDLSASNIKQYFVNVMSLALESDRHFPRVSDMEGDSWICLDHQIQQAARQFLTLAQTTNLAAEDEQRIVNGFSVLRFRGRWGIDGVVYAEALVALIYTKSEVLQKILIELIEARYTGTHRLIQDLRLDERENVLFRVCRTLPDALDANVRLVLPYCRLIVTDIMLCPYYTLEQRRDTLRPLLGSHTEYSGIQPSGSSANPLTVDSVASHVKELGPNESVSDGVWQMMQLIADFCGSEPDSSLTEKRPWGHPGIEEWRVRRMRLHKSLKRPVVSAESGDAIATNRATVVAQNTGAEVETKVPAGGGNVRLSEKSPV
ncbi:hypothetical protein RhiJN_00347 [Ceratobasidium sp. AG-Ba]|nr:hypothetical protein RhiJN_00347 [Ceratobasidium sp. AG-Ba]QRW01376.1 hypothetical protein RhiLY_00373 [Ceratobasidium sp. AG-Ba]